METIQQHEAARNVSLITSRPSSFFTLESASSALKHHVACASLGIALVAVNVGFWNTDVMFLENKDRLVRKKVRKNNKQNNKEKSKENKTRIGKERGKQGWNRK